MQIRRILILIFGAIISISAAQADAADRHFQVQVKIISPGWLEGDFPPPSPPGPNCYSFLENGTWVDPNFALQPEGTWYLEDTGGVVTRYTAMIDFPGWPDIVPPLLLVQDGQMTPARGNGKVRLQAFTSLFLGGTDIVLAEFMSTGYEVDECPPTDS